MVTQADEYICHKSRICLYLFLNSTAMIYMHILLSLFHCLLLIQQKSFIIAHGSCELDIGSRLEQFWLRVAHEVTAKYLLGLQSSESLSWAGGPTSKVAQPQGWL